MFRKILTPLDGSPLAERSLPYVEAMAQKFEADVILGWIVQTSVPVVAELGPESYAMTAHFDTAAEKERAHAYLRRLQNDFRQRQIRAFARVVENVSIPDAIIDMAVEERVDLIVKTTYARLGPSRWLRGNIAAQVLQRAPCPLFLVKVSETEG